MVEFGKGYIAPFCSKALKHWPALKLDNDFMKLLLKHAPQPIISTACINAGVSGWAYVLSVA